MSAALLVLLLAAAAHAQEGKPDARAKKESYGALQDAAGQSVFKDEEDVSSEQKMEILRDLFEGKGAQNQFVIQRKDPDGKAAADRPQTTPLAGSFYDRLSAGNIRGYSPQLMTMQNALNARRPPGAPKLIETGKLDFATLVYPAYGLRYDLDNLAERLRRDRRASLDKTPADGLPKSLASRAALIEKAKAAAAAFEAAARRSQDPAQISKDLLVELAGLQSEAARWITAAALEEELGRAKTEAGFLTAELHAAIEAVPAPASVRAAYMRRGAEYEARLARIQANARAALDALLADAWRTRLRDIDKLLGENRALRRDLSRDISVYRVVPYRIGELPRRQARWRELRDDLLIKYAASTDSGRAAAARRGRQSRLLALFNHIASGGLNAVP